MNRYIVSRFELFLNNEFESMDQNNVNLDASQQDFSSMI